MRLFIAINFSNETRVRLLALLDELRSHSERGNFSAPENLHLTLAFLGECDGRQVEGAKTIMNAITFEPFTITIAGGGYLDKGRANLVFCELINDAGRNQLWKMQSELCANLSAKNFTLDNRKFWPHITLGREVVWKTAKNKSGYIGVRFPVIEERVTGIALMKSERMGGKLTYTAIHQRYM